MNISETNPIWDLKAEYRNGQVFITWKEADYKEALTYNVYMHHKPISSGNIGEAKEIAGFIEKHSARDWWEDPEAIKPGITSTVSVGFKIRDNGERLNPLEGLFVHTITKKNVKRCYYAVTRTNEKGIELLNIEPGVNSLIEPVTQAVSGVMPIWIKEGELPKKNSALNKNLILSLHGRGSELNDITGSGVESNNNCLVFGELKHAWREGIAFKFQLTISEDAVVIRPADRAWIGRPVMESADTRDHVPAVNTWWYGYRMDLHKPEQEKAKLIVNYTEERLLWLIQWVQEYLGTDVNKTYIEGTSMGGSGALSMALHYPDKFAAVIAKVPVTAITHLGIGNLSRLEGVCGPLDHSVLTNEGIPVLERMDGVLNVQKSKADLPYIFICSGRRDPSIPWENNPPFYKVLKDTRQGFEVYWDNGEHNMVSYLPEDVKAWNSKYLKLALNKSFPSFSNCTLDKNPGSGAPEDGDLIGWLNRGMVWDEIIDEQEEYSIHIKAEGTEIVYPFNIDVTLRRLQKFIVERNKNLSVTVNGSEWKDHFVDSNNRITIENLKICSEEGLCIKLKYTENSTYKTINSIVSHIRENTGLQVKLLGDSITQGYSGTGFAQDGEAIVGGWRVNTKGYCWAKLLKDHLKSKFVCTVKNWGMSSSTSEILRTNIKTLIEAEDDIIICMIGTNDRSLEGGKQTLYNNLIAIGNYAKKLGKEIIFMSSIPASIENETLGNKYFPMEDVDLIIMSVAAYFEQEYISLYNEIMDYCDFKNITMDSLLADGLHPNDTGYLVIFNIICDKLGITEFENDFK